MCTALPSSRYFLKGKKKYKGIGEINISFFLCAASHVPGKSHLSRAPAKRR